MRLLIITPTFLPTRGGTEQVVYSLADQLSNHHDIDILTLGKGSEGAYGLPKNVGIFRIKHIRLPVVDAITGQIALGRGLEHLAVNNYDLIHMFHLYVLGGVVMRFSRKNDIPLVTTLIGWDTYDPVRPVPRILHRYLAAIMNSSAAITTSSRHMARMARSQGLRTETSIIPHGSIMWDRKSGQMDVREKYNISPEKRIVLSVQRLCARKGLGALIESIEILNRDDTVFVLCGKGKLEGHLKTIAFKRGLQDRIIFAGFVPDNELKDHYEQADLFALPSLYEGFGLVFVDAISCGLPVVTTFCGGPEEVLNETNSYMAPIDDPRRFAAALNRALERKWDRNNIREQASAYRWSHIACQYANLYEDVLSVR